MVRYEEIVRLPTQFVKPRTGKLLNTVLYDPLIDHAHRLRLEVTHGLVVCYTLANRLQRLVRIDVRGKEWEGRTISYAHHCSRNLLCIVRSDVIKLCLLHCCIYL